MQRLGALAALALTLVAATAAGQRREGGVALVPLIVQLSAPVRFEDRVVPAGRYRLSLSKTGITFILDRSMVVVATLEARHRALEKPVRSPRVELREQGSRVVLVVTVLADRYIALGTRESGAAAGASPAVYASKPEVNLDAYLPVGTPDEALVDEALERYRSSVLHCGDKAHKNRWRTDDLRFSACVCPIAQKWRLPKVTAPLRLHRVLAPGRAGFSISVMPDGRAQNCRVWIGGASPEIADEKPDAEESSPPSPAPSPPPSSEPVP